MFTLLKKFDFSRLSLATLASTNRQRPGSGTESDDNRRLEDPYLFSVFNPPQQAEQSPEHAIAR